MSTGMCLRYNSVADAAPAFSPALDVDHLAPSISAALWRFRCSLTSLSSAVSAALALSQQPLFSSLRQILRLCLMYMCHTPCTTRTQARPN